MHHPEYCTFSRAFASCWFRFLWYSSFSLRSKQWSSSAVVPVLGPNFLNFGPDHGSSSATWLNFGMDLPEQFEMGIFIVFPPFKNGNVNRLKAVWRGTVVIRAREFMTVSICMNLDFGWQSFLWLRNLWIYIILFDFSMPKPSRWSLWWRLGLVSWTEDR